MKYMKCDEYGTESRKTRAILEDMPMLLLELLVR